MTSNPTMRADAGPPAWPCGERGQGQHAMELQKRATWKKHPYGRTNISIKSAERSYQYI